MHPFSLLINLEKNSSVAQLVDRCDQSGSSMDLLPPISSNKPSWPHLTDLILLTKPAGSQATKTHNISITL